MSVSLFPWISEKLQKGGVLAFAQLNGLQEEAAPDKPAVEKFGIRSGLYIPIAALRSAEYSHGISSAQEDQTCRDEYIPKLRLLGELFANAIEPSKAELALREHLDEIEKLKAQLEKENLSL